MITGIQDVYVNVEDMARAVRFYTEALGCILIDQSPYWSSLDAHGLRLGLHGTHGQALPELSHDGHGPHAGACLTFQSDDIASDRDVLTQAGARILGHASEPWGEMLVFADPEGNILKLMRPADAS